MPREETIKVKVDKVEALQSLKELKATADSIKKELGSIKVGDAAKAITEQAKAAKENAKATVEQSKAIKESANANKALAQAEKELENATNARLRAQTSAQNVVTAKLRTAKEAVNLVKAQSSAEKEAANAEAARSRAQKAAIQTQNAINKSVSSGSQYVSHYASAMKSFATQLIGFYGITTTLRKAFTEMKAMNDELVTYRKVTGATAADMQKMQSAAYSAAKQYGQSPSDFLASAATMARAGYKENSAAMAELATKTQLVGDMTAEQASKFLIAVDAAYKYRGNIEQLSSVLDSANEIDNRYATTIEKISEGMTLVASVAATAEVPIEQLMAALGTMTAVTQREGSEAARGLRYILLHAMGDTTTEIEEGVTATEEGIQTLNEAVMKYGDESAKAALKAGKMINPMEKIVALQKAWKEGTLSKESLYDIGLKVAGQRQYNMFMALIQNPEMYNSMMKDIANSAGSADKEWQAMMDSWSKKLEKLKATFTELVNNTISTDFIKSLIDAGTGALEFAGNLENLATMATGAYMAIKALAAGIKNLQTGSKFGSFNIAGIGLGLAISAVGAWKSSFEKSIRDAQEDAAKAVSEAMTKSSTYKSLEEIRKKYAEIASDGIQEEKGELEQLKTLQDELNGLVGDQGGAIDIVNGKYDEMIEKLRTLTKEQKEQYIRELTAARTRAVNDWASARFENGIFYNPYLFEDSALINSLFGESKYWSMTNAAGGEGIEKYLTFNKPEKAEDIVEAAKEAKKIYETLGSTVLEDGVTFGNKYKEFYSQFGAIFDNISKSADPIITVTEAIDEATKSLQVEDLGKQSEAAASGMETAAKGAFTLADAIKQATAAKNAFDEAMKTSKADAFNDYTKAFQTLQKEMDAGRVNSTAFYAAAEMLMGAEAYAATGGSSSAIRKALNKRTAGDSGSALDAYKILSDTYKDYSTGETVEGFGLVELLRRTKGYGDNFVSDNEGNVVIPALTSDQIAKIANAWHVDSAFLMAAWNAFDQYDKNGTRQQDDLMDRVQETSEDAAEGENALAEGEKTLADAEMQAISAVVGLKTSFEGATDAVNTFASAINKEPQNDSDQNDSIASGTGTDSIAALYEYSKEVDELNEKVLGLKASFDSLEMKQSLTNDAKTLLQLIGAITDKDTYTFNVETGEVTNKTTGQVTSIEAALQAIKNMEDGGVITADVAGELRGHLLADLEQLGFSVDKFKENPPEIEINGNADGALDTLYGFEDTVNESESNATINGDTTLADEKVKNLETEVEQEHQFKVSDGVSEELMRDVDKIDDATLQLQRAYTLSVADGNKVDSSKLNTILATTAELGKNYTFNVTNGEGVAAAEATITKLENAIKLVSGMASSGLISEDDAAKLTAGFQGVIDSLSKSIEDYNKDPKKVKVDADDKDAKDKIAGLEAGPYSAVVNTTANLDPAKSALAAFLKEPASKTVKVYTVISETKTVDKNGNTRKSIEFADQNGNHSSGAGSSYATGTRNHPGGLSLVNDGSGPELIVNDGQAFIAGGGKPTIVSLSKGAKVFTASETRQIFGGSVPAYADGTSELVGSGSSSGLKLGNVGTGNKKYNIVLSSDKKITSKKKSNSSKSSSAKVDEKAFSNLSTMVDYIIGRIGDALDEQLDVIDAQIEALKKAREAAEEQNKLEELQKNVTDALNERTVRYLGEDGKWHWMADQKNVQQAQKALKEYQDELAFNAQVNELEQQKKALQDEYNEITKTWSGIKDAVNTPTGSLSDLINQVLANGTAQQKAGANAVSGTLISGITGSVYTKNYDEALSAIAKATAGNPVMPGSGAASLASLIATAGAGATEASITEALKTAASPSASITGSNGSLAAGNNTNINYFIDGIKLGEGMENMPLSSIMKNLSVYTNTGVN